MSCASLVIDIMLCAVRLCLLVDLVPRENAQVSTTSATQPQCSPSTLRARISAQTSPLELHLRPQGVQTERSAGRHHRRRQLPKCRQEQSNQHPQVRQGEASRLL